MYIQHVIAVNVGWPVNCEFKKQGRERQKNYWYQVSSPLLKSLITSSLPIRVILLATSKYFFGVTPKEAISEHDSSKKQQESLRGLLA